MEILYWWWLEAGLCLSSNYYSDVIMSLMGSQITSVLIVCSTVYSGADQRKGQNSVLLTLCEGNPPMTGGFPSQRASNIEKVSI